MLARQQRLDLVLRQHRDEKLGRHIAFQRSGRANLNQKSTTFAERAGRTGRGRPGAVVRTGLIAGGRRIRTPGPTRVESERPAGPQPGRLAQQSVSNGAALERGHLDAAPRVGLVQGRTSDTKPTPILPAGGQKDLIMGNSAGPQLDLLARGSHPTERGSERQASDLSPSKRSIPKRQTKGSGKVAPRCLAQTNG
jgi:hypothetical protein